MLKLGRTYNTKRHLYPSCVVSAEHVRLRRRRARYRLFKPNYLLHEIEHDENLTQWDDYHCEIPSDS